MQVLIRQIILLFSHVLLEKEQPIHFNEKLTTIFTVSSITQKKIFRCLFKRNSFDKSTKSSLTLGFSTYYKEINQLDI